MKKSTLGLYAALATTFISATMAGAQTYGNGSSVTRRPNSFLEAQLVTDRTQYTPNRAVQITLTLTNMGNTRWVRNSTAAEYTLAIRDSRTNKIVYDLSRHKRVSSERFMLDSGESRTYSELWDKRDDDGQALRPGVYVVEAKLWPQQMISTQIYLSDRNGGNGGGNGGGTRPDFPGDNPDPSNPQEGAIGKVTFLPRRPTPGDTVSFSYTVRNRSARAILYRFDSGKQFEVSVRDRNNRQVWNSSEGMFSTMALTNITLMPGQEKAFSATWRIPYNFREGNYTINASLPTRNVGDGGVNAEAAAIATLVIGRDNSHNGGSDNGNGSDFGGSESGNGGFGGGQSDGFSGGQSGGGFGGGQSGNEGNYGGDGNYGGGSQEGNGGGINAPFFVSSLRELTGPRANFYAGRRIRVNAIYNGNQGGVGQPPVSRNAWVITDAGTNIYVVGSSPDALIGRRITVTGIVRSGRDGRPYLQTP